MAEAVESKKSNRSWLWLLLLLLLLIAGAVGYYLYFMKDDGTFVLRFEGCDDAGKCAEFTMHAPGYDYRFAYGKTSLDPIEGAPPQWAPVLERFKRDAREGVIAAGLASRESGPGFDNRKLSACRSMALSRDLEAAQAAAGISAPMYRVSLGRYAADDTGESGDTSIERLAVLAFIRSQEPGVDLSQALKNGLTENLPGALAKAVAPIARQLDFTRYECWSDEFSVTPSGEARSVCYAEASADPATVCRGLN
ncbi:MAG: hypothetical protein AAFW46_12650 [Pseudomonadota bacterium]